MNVKMKAKLPPGPRAPAIVQLVRMSMNPYGLFHALRAKYGDTFTIHLPGQAEQVVCCDPDDVKKLVGGSYEAFTRFAEGIRFILGDHAVIFQQDAEHKETRRLMVPPFVGERMRAYGADMAAITDEVISRMRDGERRELHKDLQDVTLRVILRCVFGISEEARLTALAEHFTRYLEALMTPWFYGATLVLTGRRVRRWLNARGERVRRGAATLSRFPLQRVADHLGAIDALLLDEIRRCRALPNAELSRRSDILAMLVGARFDDGSAMSDEVLRDHLMTLLIGGHETTATTLAWAIDCAVRHPGTLERMRAEVDAVMGGGFDGSRVRKLDYVGAVVNESMRLFPIATMVSRTLKEDMVLGGRVVPAGTVVSPCNYLIQRDARVWKDADRFLPERWLATGKAPPHEFFPFGAGVWRCLGAQFAEYEMRVVLARLVARLDLASEPGVKVVPMQRGFTVAPSHGMPVRVRHRRGDTVSTTRSSRSSSTQTSG
jgi:cytochrome P450